MAKKNAQVKRTNEATQIVVNNITVSQLQRGNQDIQTWIQAVKSAESILSPNRKPLLRVYQDVSIDLHLTSLIDKRTRAVKTTPFEWPDLKDEGIIDNFQSPWFAELLGLIQSRIFWGHTLLEVGLNSEDGLIGNVELIPRQNVKPEKGLISKDGNSDDGFLYREGIYANYILEVGKGRELGLLANLAPYVLMKRSNLADFSRYNEMFGMPLRVYKYNPNNPGAKAEVEAQAKEYGSAAYIVLPEGASSVEFHDSVKQSTAYAYDKLHEILNNEMTIGVLGQLLTTGGEGGGSYELGKVHKSVEAAINLEDRLYCEYVINYPFRKNILIPHGYPLADIKGKFKTADEVPKEKKLELWISMVDKGVPIAEEDFYKEFGILPPGSRPVVVRTTNSTPPDGNSGPDNQPAPEPPANPKPAGGAGKGKPGKATNSVGDVALQLSAFYDRKHFCERDKSPGRVTLGYKSELDTLIETIIKKIQSGELKPGEVDPALYGLTSEELWAGVEKGYGVKLEKASGPDYAMLKALRTNVYVFSGFKNYQFLRAATDLLTDADGKVKAFSQFRDDVLKLNATYNVDFLRTEYNYAVASSQMAGKWVKFTDQKGTLPLLQYITVGDARVRAAHAALDGIIKPVDDPFWDSYMPPNSWNCRCSVRQLADGEITQTRAEDLPQLNDMFKINPGKQAVVFPKSHPYYNVDPADQKAADSNFNLPIPE